MQIVYPSSTLSLSSCPPSRISYQSCRKTFEGGNVSGRCCRETFPCMGRLPQFLQVLEKLVFGAALSDLWQGGNSIWFFTLFTNHAFPAEPNTRWRCPTVQNGTLIQHIKHQLQGDHAHTTIAPNGITSNLIETKTQPLSFSPNMWFWWESSGPSAGPRKFNFAQWRYSNQ